MSYKNVSVGLVLILATASSAAVADTSGKRGIQQRQWDVETTQGIDRRRDPSGISDPAPVQEMRMVPFPRGGRLEMILVPVDPAS